MFEVFLDQPRARQIAVEDVALTALNQTRRCTLMSSGLVWGEHCTECAWPTCYSHCSLYTPRADLNCRRFAEGIVPVTVAGLSGAGGQAMRISFRQWGKLEAHEQVRLSSRAEGERLRRADAAVRGALRVEAAPYAIRKRVGYAWGDRLRGRVRGHGGSPDVHDVFVLEVVNEGRQAAPFTITVLGDGTSGRFFQHGFLLEPGYNRVLLGADSIAEHVDLSAPVFVRIEPTRVDQDNSFVFLTVDFLRLSQELRPIGGDVRAADASPPKVKCVVWDLDNTVWTGTLVEDGPEAVQVRPEVVEMIRALDARGVLQSVASKNDHEHALPVLEQAGLSEYMLHPQISWGPKSDALASLSQVLNIGIDTLVFVDDQPFERAEVQTAHPSVRVVDALDLTGLLDRPDFDLPVTDESRRRRSMYREESQRRSVLAQAPSDFEAFLRTCDIRLRLMAPSVGNAERIYELAQRTNQLNYSGARLERDEVDQIVQGTSPLAGVVLSASDRFGDYGIIGFVTIDLDTFTITNFFMSCRVQRKRVENAFFTHLLAAGDRQGHAEVKIQHRATARNGPAVEVLQSLGATPSTWNDEDGEHPEVLYSMSCGSPPPDADIVTVNDDVLRHWQGRQV